MGTNAIIAVKRPTGYSYVHVNYDGYLDGVGKLLKEVYNSEEQANAILALGNLSALYESLEKPVGHSWATPVPGYSIAYGRDRGEARTQASFVQRKDELMLASYMYVWEDGRWLYAKAGRYNFIPL